MSDAPLRAFVCAPDAGLVESIVRDLGGSRVSASGHTDPRALAQQGDVDAIVLSQTWSSPPVEAIGAALERIAPQAVRVLLTLTTPGAGTDLGPFDAAIRYPVGGPVLVSRLVRAVKERARGGGGPAPEFLADLELRIVRSASQNHYEVLGLPTDANLDQVKRAYDRLSLRVHPDRLRGLGVPELQDGANGLYIRITEAYQTLRNLSSRTRYDRSLQTGRAFEPGATRGQDGVLALWELSDVPGAQKYLRLAHQAIVRKDNALALVHMRFAATLDEGNAAIAQRIETLEGSSS